MEVGLDATRRAALEALLNRQEGDNADNPPLSILFGRYYAERKLPAKTKLEWDGVLKRFTTICGDLPVTVAGDSVSPVLPTVVSKASLRFLTCA